MATLQELIEQYATELPDYLRVKPGDAAARGLASIDPSAIPAIPQESKDTEKTTLRKSLSLKDLKADYEAKKKAEEDAFTALVSKREEQIAEKAPRTGGLVLEPVETEDPYAKSLSAIRAAKDKAMPQKPESDLLAEALITFLPALLGAGAGAAFAGPGGAGAGLAGGAAAGAGAVSKMKEEQQKALEAQRKVGLEYLDNVTKLELLKLKQAEERAMLPEQVKLFGAKELAKETFRREYDPLKQLAQFSPEIEKWKSLKGETGASLRALQQAQLQGVSTIERGKQIGTGKPGKPVPSEAALEWKKLPPPIQTQVQKLATFKAQSQGISIAIDPQIEIISNPKNSEAVRQSAGELILTSLNAAQANSPNAVGEGEAMRIGSLNQTKFANFLRAGSFMGNDLPDFLKLVRQIQAGIKKRSGMFDTQIRSLYKQGGAKYYGDVIQEQSPQGTAAEPTLRDVYPKMTDQEKSEYQSATPDRRKKIIIDASKR